MDFRATKTHGEREDDEAKRLVRPAPKDKPPRHDLRRNLMKPDEDPDTDADLDISKDKDKSRNYKNIGGSAGRVLRRFLAKSGKKERVQAINQDGEIVSVTRETLEKYPDKFKKHEEKQKTPEKKGPPKEKGLLQEPKPLEESKPLPESKPVQQTKPLEESKPLKPIQEETPSKGEDGGDIDYEAEGDALWQMADEDESLKEVFDKVLDETDALYHYAKNKPHTPIKHVVKAPLPGWIKTLGDLWKALTAKHGKGGKGGKGTKPLNLFKHTPGKSVNEPKKPKHPKLKHEKPEAEPEAEPEAVPSGKPKEKVAPDIGKFEPAIGARPPTEEPEGAQPEEGHEKVSPDIGKFEPAIGARPPEEEKVPPSGKRPKKKPEAAPVGEVKPKKTDEEISKEVVDRFVGGGQHKSTGFQEYLNNIPTSDKPAGVEDVQVLDPDTKTRVPFEKLSPARQKALIDGYEAKETDASMDQAKVEDAERAKQHGKTVTALLDKVQDHKARYVLDQLGDPESDASKKLAEVAQDNDLKFVRPGKIFPELEGNLPEELKTLDDVSGAVKLRSSYESLSEAAKRDIPEPKRRKVSEAEEEASSLEVADTFPPDMAAEILGKGLHPDDTRELIRQFHAAKSQRPKDLSQYVEQAKAFYQTDPNKVRPPKTVTKDGVTTDFDKLPPEEQGEALRQHQMKVMAASMAVKDRLTYELSMPSITNKPRVPVELASKLAEMTLHKGSDEFAEEDATETFNTVLTSGQYTPIKDKVASELLSKLDEGSKRVAQAYLQANDYQEAKSKFLTSNPNPTKQAKSEHSWGEPEDEHEDLYTISEWDSPRKIAKGLQKASEFFNQKAELYGTPTHPAAAVFRVRVLSKLRALAPEKYEAARNEVAKTEANEYDDALKKHEAWKKSQKGPEPPKPEKPLRYDIVRGKTESEGKDLFENLATQSKVGSWHANSSYPTGISMGTSLSRQAVYHGIDPSSTAFNVYRKWSQPHQRDAGESDYQTILAQAKDWLKAPVLSMAYAGTFRDTQLRAALDLAIQTTNYKLDPNTYNALLSRLGGKQASKSSYESASGEVKTMSTSAKLRKLAAKASIENPKFAFDLMKIAEEADDEEKQDKDQQKQAANNHPPGCTCPICQNMKGKGDGDKKDDDKKEAAQQQKKQDEPKDDDAQKQASKYASLRSAVIRTAASDDAAKRTLLPVLQVIKQLG
jgi:hypothetical protein